MRVPLPTDRIRVLGDPVRRWGVINEVDRLIEGLKILVERHEAALSPYSTRRVRGVLES